MEHKNSSINSLYQDPLDNLMFNVVSNLVKKRKSILQYSQSFFNNCSFYGSETQKDTTSAQTNFVEKKLPHSFSSDSINRSNYSLSSNTNSEVVLSENLIDPSSYFSPLESSIHDSLKIICLDKNILTPSSSSNSINEKNRSDSSSLTSLSTSESGYEPNGESQFDLSPFLSMKPISSSESINNKVEKIAFKTNNHRVRDELNASPLFNSRKTSKPIKKSSNSLFASLSENDFQDLKNRYTNFINSQMINLSSSEPCLEKHVYFQTKNSQGASSSLYNKHDEFESKNNLRRSENIRKIQILSDQNLKPSQRITSYEDELANLFQRINFNDIEPGTYDFLKWKTLIKYLKGREDLKRYALSKTSSDFNNLDELVEFLKKSPAKSEIEKCWIIFVWITEHIRYDDESYERGKCDYNEPEDVLWQGRCTCEG